MTRMRCAAAPLFSLMAFWLCGQSTVESLSSGPLYLGFDLGTSGARISIIESMVETGSGSATYSEVYSDAIPWDGAYDDEKIWMEAVHSLLKGASDAMNESLKSVASICVSGTSASCLLVDSSDAGKATRKPRMYDFDIASSASTERSIYALRALELLDKHAPPKHTARAKTGSLAKLLSWNAEQPLDKGEVLCHQADYITMNLMHDTKKCGSGLSSTKRVIRSDWHNCLKAGYDVGNLQWPSWLVSCLEDAGMSETAVPSQVVSPGEPLGQISGELAKRYGLSESTVVVGGTTDSNAAFFAAVGGTQPDMGTAVTSLGSTLAMKQLSSTFVEDADRGVYSHRFPTFSVKGNKEKEEAWLVGGASNVGCAVLRQEKFSNEELQSLSRDLDYVNDSPLSYYPLTKTGERFPVADSERQPVLEPVPESRLEYLRGILQGISDVERDGFKVLGELGAQPNKPRIVWTCGGGSNNEAWSKMRERRLVSEFEEDQITVRRAENTEASFGAAILASASFL